MPPENAGTDGKSFPGRVGVGQAARRVSGF